MSAPDHAGFEAGTPLKVVGLGAPISVRIAFEISEIPALLDAIDEQLGRYGAAVQRNGRGGATPADVDPADWSDHIGELRRMRADVEQAKEVRGAERVVVMWPTVLAHDVVHVAVRHAQRRAAAGAAGAREAVAAAERSRHDFDAVDTGGLDGVWL
jgi:hypothetical protein